MKYLFFSDNEKIKYRIAILVNKIRKDQIIKEYITPFNLPKDDVIVIDLHQTPGKKKTTALEKKKYITEELVPVFESLDIQYVMVADGEYFKTIANKNKVDLFLGYVLPTPYGPQQVIYTPSVETVFYDPEKIRDRIKLGFSALLDHMSGVYVPPGDSIIQYANYPMTVEAIAEWLEKLLEMNCPLSCDIEGFSLKHYSAGIGTITLCWNQNEGIAFPVDILGDSQFSIEVRSLLIGFFRRMKHPLLYHNIAYDVTVLIYQLFMKDILDTEGLLEGLSVMLKNWHDTRLIAYLATNSCAGNRLGLKDQAQEFAGNYAVEEIKDIRKIPLPDLLQYNLVDGLSTWYVYNKHWQTVIDDNQLNVYRELFQPAMVDIIQMQLTGMPIDMKRVGEVRIILQADNDDAINRMFSNPLVQNFNYNRLEEYVERKNREWKKKRTTVAETQKEALTNDKIREETTFNPNSGPQLIHLLYESIGLPVLGRTDSGLPSTEGEILKALKNHTTDERILSLLDALIDFKAVNKILTSTLIHMEQAQEGPDGWHYLFGNFNLGGTVSGRLSSSDPNLQNLPATGTRYAKLVKSCFKAPPGWFFCGIDFNSLEDRISALTTKDPNKLKVYQGHVIYAVDVEGEIHHIRDDDIIVYDGRSFTGDEFYAAYTSGLL